MIELSPRLRMVAGLIPEGSRLADVGTDHAYLPAALILEGRIPSAIAADLRPGPLDRARETVRRAGLGDRVAFRLCDGLKGIAPGETDAVAIAGMGGENIASILRAAPWVRERGVPLALQPMSSMGDLRLWLQQNGYHITEERLCREGETIYTALSVRAGEMPALTPAELWVGKNSPDPLRGEWLDHWLHKAEHALAGMALGQSEQTAARQREMEEIKRGLLEMREEWSAWQR